MEGKMRQEINYLTKLIQQHKDSTKVLSPSKRHWQNPNKYSYIKPKIKSTNIYLNPNFQPLKNKSRCTYKSDSSKCNSVSPGPTIIWENGTNLQNQNQNQKQNHPVILVNPLKIQEVKRKVVLENLGKSSGETSVYMNPRIRETLKAIHVDPKLITSLSSTSRKEQIEVELEGEKKQEPKSQELKVHNANKTVLTEMPVEILQEIKKTRQDQSTGLKNSSWKGSSPNLVILSKRKLVRVKRSCSSTSPVASGTSRIQRLPSMAISTGVKRSKSLIEQRHLLIQSTKIKNKYKIDRTKVKKNISRSKIDFPRRRNEKLGLVRIGDVFYNSSKSHLVKSVQVKSKSRKSESELKSPNKHLVEKNRKKLRVPTSKENLQKPQRMNYKSNITNKVKQRSIQILRNKMRKINQPCLIYQKFGFCANQAKGTCPKLHDKKQVSLCRNFLQGKCILDDCPLSHDIVPEKMPTCKYFLDGCCVRDNCPYLHVKVSPNTPVCIPFLRGYCANGNQCKERHVNICPQFEKSGKCSQGKHCPYPHNPRNKASTYAKRKINVNNSQVDKSIEIIEVVTNTADKRRYYEKADTTSAPVGTLSVERDTDRENTLRQIRALKENLTIMENSLNSLSATFTRAQEEQPVESIVVNSAHENLARRKPIGPLPSYIPI